MKKLICFVIIGLILSIGFADCVIAKETKSLKELRKINHPKIVKDIRKIGKINKYLKTNPKNSDKLVEKRNSLIDKNYKLTMKLGNYGYYSMRYGLDWECGFSYRERNRMDLSKIGDKK